MTAAILVINAGSSSIKFGLYARESLDDLLRGVVELAGHGVEHSFKGALAPRLADLPSPAPAGHAAAIGWLLETLRARLGDYRIAAAGHRVVHGGANFAEPVMVDDDVLALLETLVELAPGHEPHNIAGIRAIAAVWPQLPQVACFDTAFHRRQPRLAQIFALPRALTDSGILRYGFHGLSYEYVAEALPAVAGERAEARVVVAHLGNGASMCAMRNRRSVASTMGFTALDGLMMGTRSGAVDPGVVLHLLQGKRLSPEAVADILYNRSGLLGVSGLSADMRALEESGDPRAAEALDLFAYRAARELGSLVAALGGLDALVFTAGIGEHSAAMRKSICVLSAWTGLALDDAANARHAARISAEASKVAAYVIPTNEELVLARATKRLVPA